MTVPPTTTRLRPPPCGCLDPPLRPGETWDDADDADDADARPWAELALHDEPQDTECPGWLQLVDAVEQAAESGARRFKLSDHVAPEHWHTIVTLPTSIAKLTEVTELYFYGSHIVRVPREIGAMRSLTTFTPYTSHRLHWFPYEITRCTQLRSSSVSTRALYGNYKTRIPFPRLGANPPAQGPFRPCSVCDAPFEDRQRHRVWITLRIATDVLPLLVDACSEECVARLPTPADGYVDHPHRGGLELAQPPPRW